jgi:predicted DNA-binding protein (MmcQ/YjbR family)
VPPDPLLRLRALCLALPEAVEKLSHGEPAFFVNGKMFAMHASAANHHGAGRASVWIKSTTANQDLMLRDDPARYFKPPYVGVSGWIGLWLDRRPAWSIVGARLQEGYTLVAPKRLLLTPNTRNAVVSSATLRSPRRSRNA